MKALFRPIGSSEFFWRRDGAVAVEFALVSPAFIAILLALLQLGLVYFAQQELETAVEKTSRLILTGQAKSLTRNEFGAKVCSNLPALFDCSGVMVDVQTADAFDRNAVSAPTLTYNAQGQVTNIWKYDVQDSGAIVILRVMYQWPTSLGPLNFDLSNLSNGKRLLMATAAFKNESF